MKEKFMLEAIELAVENVRKGGGPFAALVVREGGLIASGVNQVTATNDPTAHAEVVAIREACRKLNSFQLTGCEVYATCEPCPMCLGATYWARLARVYFGSTREDAARFGFDDLAIYQQLQVPHGQRTIPFILLRPARALAPFEAWKRSEDKTVY
ncbi:MAG: nucleoside deaminase [Gallionella sp.]